MSMQGKRRRARNTRASRRHNGRAVVVALATVAAVSGVASGSAAAQPAGASSVVVHEGVLTGKGAGQQSSSAVQAHVFRTAIGAKKPDEQPNVLTKPSKIAPHLAAKMGSALRGGTAGKRVRVLITFDEDQKVPRMPAPVVSEPRTSSANLAARARANALVNGLEARRADGYRQIRTDLKLRGADVVDEFWLIKAVEALVPLKSVNALADRADVRHIELDATGARPPADTDPDNDEADARARMRTDPYFGLNQTAGWIGLLDTGVRATHTLFNNPWHLAIREDLTSTTSPNPDDDCWNHGTSTAAIMTGNGNLGDAFRGITGISVDSFKVYPSGCGGLSAAAAVNGFQRAVNVLDRVIVAEMQAGGNETSAISTAADRAFDAGAVVIAANGNNGSNASTVNVPAVAQKALGVGAVDVKTLATPAYQSLGPAGDGRIKPDIQAPTNVETASSAGTTATQVFTGTSAATPHAAGAAALIRNFLRGGTGNVDPGEVYAFMIMSGTNAYPFNNTNGAGRVNLPINGNFWRGSTAIANAQTVDIPIGVPATNNQLNAAIWWPEAPATHNDIDLSLVDPAGTVRASSPSASGVFERVSINGPVAGGTWKLRIRGYNVPSGSQQVYFAATHTTP
jgi:serine protease AprX